VEILIKKKLPSPVNLYGPRNKINNSSRSGEIIKGYDIDNVDRNPDNNLGDSEQRRVCLRIIVLSKKK
jgi:hypothetical protein